MIMTGETGHNDQEFTVKMSRKGGRNGSDSQEARQKRERSNNVLTSDPGFVSSLQPVFKADKNISIIVYISPRPDTHPIVTIVSSFSFPNS